MNDTRGQRSSCPKNHILKYKKLSGLYMKWIKAPYEGSELLYEGAEMKIGSRLRELRYTRN